MGGMIVESLRGLWVFLKGWLQLVRGVYRISRLWKPVVTVFGGRAAYEGGKYSAWAHEFGNKCAQKKIAIITGGGPGIMEAANCGVYEGSGRDKRSTLGIVVKGVDQGFKNPCTENIEVDHFFVRKWLLIRYSCAFVLFPGGIGTMDEFFDVLNLMELGKTKKVPIVMVGTSYWKSFLEWYDHAFEYELIVAPSDRYFTVTDDMDEVIRIVDAAGRCDS